MSDQNPLMWPVNFALSPVYGLLDSARKLGDNVPLLSPIGNLAGSALDNLDWRGVENWRDDNPLASGVADIASFFIPGVGYAKLGEGLGALPGLTKAAAELGGSNAAARFALGETARWAPFNAGITAFDAGAGNFSSPGDAVTNFVLGNALGGVAGLAGGSEWAQAGKRAIQAFADGGPRPTLGEHAANAVSFFGPAPEQRALYGLGPEEASNPAIQKEVSNWDISEPVQLWGRRANQLLNDAVSGARPDVNQREVNNLIGALRRESLQETVAPGESYVRFPYPTEPSVRRIWNQEFTPGETSTGLGKRETLARLPGQGRDSDTIANELQLPSGWEFLGRFYRHRTATTEDAAKALRRRLGLTTADTVDGSRRIARVVNGPDGPYSQTWSIRHEDQGMWIMSTELPQMGKNRRFLIFKTDQPGAFFPDSEALARDVDNPWNFSHIGNEHLGPRAWENPSTIPDKVGPFMDTMRDMQKTILSPENFRALARSARGGGDGAKILAARLGRRGGVPGLNLGNLIEHYLKPTMFQFRNSPLAAQVYQLRRAIFDAGDAMKQEIVFGRQSLPKDKSIISGVFGGTEAGPQPSIYSELRKFLSDPDAREQWRKLYLEDDLPVAQWPEGPAKDFQTFALGVNRRFTDEFNRTLSAIGERPLDVHPEHAGIGHSFSVKGSNFYPVMNANGDAVALGVGHSAARAKQDALEWIDWRKNKGDTADYHIGDHFTSENLDQLSSKIKEVFFTPGFYQPREGMGGFKWQREKIDNLEELIQAFDRSYAARTRHLADRVGEALSAREHAQLLRTDPQTAELLATRLNALKGISGPLDKIQNRILDKALAPVLGVGSATKIVQKMNEAMHHLSFGAGNLAYPLLNATSILQTSLPEVATILATADDDLARMAYYLPTPGANGKPRGVTAVVHAPGGLWRANKILQNPTDIQREVFERLAKDADLGPRYAEEYLGQNRSRVLALSEGVRSPEDLGRWAGAVSSFLPAQTEKLARTFSAAMGIDAFERLAKIRGIEFTPEQLFRNVQNFTRRTNYMYSVADRPQIFTTPLGSLFGGFKNWMMHYLFVLADYTGLAAKGNFAPLLMSLGTTAGLGGLMALPFLGQALDWMTETFDNKDLMEDLTERFGAGANPIAFGLPAALGVSLSGATAAPGARFAHDIDFMMGVVALDRLGNMGRAVGKWWDDYATTGQDPWSDPEFVQRMLQGFGPRSLYRAWDVYSDATLNSSSTGNPMTRKLNPMEQLQTALGFTPVEVEREYEIYSRLIEDRAERTRMTGLFGEAYMRASQAQDQTQMEEILRVATMRGLDVSGVMRSAVQRAKSAGRDMLGRNLPPDVLARYPAALATDSQGEPTYQAPL